MMEEKPAYTKDQADDRTWLELDLKAPWAIAENRYRLLFVAINMPGYYSLPVRMLSLLASSSPKTAERFDCRFVEMDNIQPVAPLLARILDWQPDLIAFSVNIWNRNIAVELADNIRQRLPSATILGGGQEVTGSSYDFLQFAPAFDYLIDGEGERPLLQFLEQWQADGRLADVHAVSGLWYHGDAGSACTRPADLVEDLDEVPSVILAGLVPVTRRNLLGVMLEGSRGCPFRCSFCFEGAKKGKVRTASIARLQQEVEFMVGRGAKYFHIMDAILCNTDPARLRQLKEIFASVKERVPKNVVLVELYADRVTPEVAECLAPFSIIDLGLQTTNPETVKAIHRSFAEEKYRQGVELLRQTGSTFNIYLICGLPYETLVSFLKGIRFVLDQSPTRLFINELCLLNGTELRRRAAEFGYAYDPDPPYVVHETAWMSRFILRLVQVMAKALERRYNLSSRSLHTTAPWLPKIAKINSKPLALELREGCSLGCQGCLGAEPNLIDCAKLNQLLEGAADQDVHVFTGDGAGGRPGLLQLAGQLQLAATARNRIIGPLSMFGDREWLDRLIHRGFWHYLTFFRLDDGSFTAREKELLAIVDHFNRAVQLVGYAAVQPDLEIVLLPGDANPDRYKEMILELAKRRVTLVSVPIELAEKGIEWEHVLVASFVSAIENRLWLKLPEKIAKKAFASLGETAVDEIVEQLRGFGMISSATAQPPCFLEEPQQHIREL